MIFYGRPVLQSAVLQSYTQVQAAWFMVELSLTVIVSMPKSDLLYSS